MKFLDWFLIILIWFLIPLMLIYKARWDKKIEKWKQEDAENFKKFVKTL